MTKLAKRLAATLKADRLTTTAPDPLFDHRKRRGWQIFQELDRATARFVIACTKRLRVRDEHVDGDAFLTGIGFRILSERDA